MPRPVLGNYDGAVVSGFFVFGTRSGGGLAPPQILKSDEMLKATLLYVSRSSSSSYDNWPQETIGFWVGTREA